MRTTRRTTTARRKRLAASHVLVLFVFLVQCHNATAAASSGGGKRFLYVPEGVGEHSENGGVVLRQIDRSQLPPGEYEVVAMFDGGHEPGSGGSPFSDYRRELDSAVAADPMTGQESYRHHRPRPVPPRRMPPPQKFANFPDRHLGRQHHNQRSSGFEDSPEHSYYGHADYVSGLTQRGGQRQEEDERHPHLQPPTQVHVRALPHDEGRRHRWEEEEDSGSGRVVFVPQHLKVEDVLSGGGRSDYRRHRGEDPTGDETPRVYGPPPPPPPQKPRRHYRQQQQQPPPAYDPRIHPERETGFRTRFPPPPPPPPRTTTTTASQEDFEYDELARRHRIRPSEEEAYLRRRHHHEAASHDDDAPTDAVRTRELPRTHLYGGRPADVVVYNDPRSFDRPPPQPPATSAYPRGDHWDGYDPYYKSSRRKYADRPSSAIANDLFVTPVPKKREIAGREQELYQNGLQEQPPRRPSPPRPPTASPPPRLANAYRTKARKVLPGSRGAAEDLKKLYEIAAGGGKSDSHSPESKGGSSFVCPRDGHFPDETDCAKYYRCAHGKAMEEFCPGNLFWNSVSDQCDWPETVDCRYNAASLANYRAKSPDSTLFLTFDDGPNNGTGVVLDALKNQGVRATFFINSKYIHDPDPKIRSENIAQVLRIVREGHTLGDHSYDHMFHNSRNSPRNAYVDVGEDVKYFGLMNTYPVLDILWKNGMKADIPRVNHTMTYYVRMPYTNNWRVGEQHRDCHGCTVPASSGNKGIAITNILHQKGKLIFGWDMEWEINWDQNRFKYGGKEMFFKMGRDPWLKPKTVILSHDIAHRPWEARDEGEELEEFISLAKEAGYKFDTVDNY